MADTKQWNLPAKTVPVDTDKLSGTQGPNVGDDKSFSFGAIKAWVLSLLNPRFTAIEAQATVLKNLARIAPVYAQPAIYLTGSPANSNLEIGQHVSVALSVTFQARDSGGLSAQSISKNGSVVDTDGSYTDANLIISNTPVNYRANVVYLQGPVKKDNFGDDYQAGQIGAGNINSGILPYAGSYATWSGPIAAPPASSADVRNNGGLTKVLMANMQNNAFSVITGTTLSKFMFAVPNAFTIDTVEDLSVSGVVMTDGFIGYDLQIADGGGTLVDYTVFVFTQAIPYSTSHTLRVTIKPYTPPAPQF